MPLFKKVKLAERYDIAIMSTKGMSVTASRSLVDDLCATAGGIPLFVLHDFDKAGFSILGTLQRDTRRYQFENKVKVIDLGLRLEDVEQYQLMSEVVSYGKKYPGLNLRQNSATDDEIKYLCSGRNESYGTASPSQMSVAAPSLSNARANARRRTLSFKGYFLQLKEMKWYPLLLLYETAKSGSASRVER